MRIAVDTAGGDKAPNAQVKGVVKALQAADTDELGIVLTGDRDILEGELSKFSKVENISVPIPHFGCVLDWNSFHDLADKLQSADIKFIVEPSVRFQDLLGEQATMFFEDYSGNAIELKAYRNPSEVFSK